MSDGDLPAYVDRPGEQVLGPPYVAHCSRLYLLFVDAKVDDLNQLIDEGLNAPLQAHYGVTPAFQASRQRIIFMFADIPRMYSDAEAYLKMAKDHQKKDTEPSTDEISTMESTLGGDYVHEVELSVWIPLVRTVHGRNTPGFYLPFVFNDSPASVATGREVYGYPKQLAHIDVDPDTDFERDAAPLKTIDLSTWHIPPGDSQDGKEYKSRPLLQITLPTVTRAAGPWKDAVAGRLSKGPGVGRPRLRFSEIPRDDRQEKPGGGAPPDGSESQAFAQNMVQSAPLYFLRQFRDPVHPGRATDQRLIEARFVIQRTPTTNELVGAGSIEFFPSRTLDLPTVLGLRPTQPTPISEALVIEDLTFTVDLGKDLLA